MTPSVLISPVSSVTSVVKNLVLITEDTEVTEESRSWNY